MLAPAAASSSLFPASTASSVLCDRGAVRGELHLRFRPVAHGASCLTVVDALVQTPPLRVVRPFPLPDGAALVHLHNLSGGVLGGDTLHTTLEVAAGARAQVTTTGATRIYRRRPGQAPATQQTVLHVGADALLEYLPDPVIPYAGSAYIQCTHITLAPGAGLFAWDVFAPGRKAHGECFAYDHLAWETVIAVTASTSAPAPANRLTPIAIERALLEPALRPLTATARLGHFHYVATFVACRVGVAPARWLAIEQALAAIADHFTASPATWWGVSTLSAHGVIVRGLSVSGHTLPAALAAFWRSAKELLYGEIAIPPRKIY